MTAATAQGIALGAGTLLLTAMLLVWRPIVARIGPRRAWIAASLCFIPGFTVILLADTFYVGLVGTLLAVPGLAGSMIMPFPLLSEVIDDDAARHGYDVRNPTHHPRCVVSRQATRWTSNESGRG